MDNQTLHTYNKSAKQLADKFAGIGSRKADVKRAFELRGKANPRVLELGCGDGRDAKEILKGTKNYAGIDYSSELIELARAKNPKTKFEVRDMLTYDFGSGLDIIFAFASLLHVDKTNVTTILEQAKKSLSTGGIFYISLKKDSYQSKVQTDEFGTRIFYYYEPKDIEEIKPNTLKTVFLDHQTIGYTDWFTIALQKTT
ncbi:MAG: class I SAM-dependent methyltransferase [Candidatus Saccharibacteria bacterium]